MDNKLSELSKPVAWKFKNADGGDRVSLERKANIYGRHNFQPLYSQEYVSALRADAAKWFEAFQKAVSIGARYEERIAELELRLAVEIEPPPVIYPGRYDCHAMHSAIRRAEFRVLGDSEHVGDVDMRDERALAAVSDKQRIAELERSNTSQDDHINQQQDRIEFLEKTNAGLGRRLGDAEKRLATPVRLTDERTLWAGEDDYDTGHVKGWNANRIEQAALLKKQGFKVEGDE